MNIPSQSEPCKYLEHVYQSLVVGTERRILKIAQMLCVRPAQNTALYVVAEWWPKQRVKNVVEQTFCEEQKHLIRVLKSTEARRAKS